MSTNKVVSLEYELKDAKTGEILDSNVGKEPLEYISGKGQIIPGLENRVNELKAGESAEIKVPASEAYGDINPEAVQTLPKEQFAGIDLEEGMVLYGQGENGETVQVTVKSFDDNSVVVDFNHPLAGKDLIFNVKVLNLRDATESEVATGVVGSDSCGCGTGCGC